MHFHSQSQRPKSSNASALPPRPAPRPATSIASNHSASPAHPAQSAQSAQRPHDGAMVRASSAAPFAAARGSTNQQLQAVAALLGAGLSPTGQLKQVHVVMDESRAVTKEVALGMDICLLLDVSGSMSGEPARIVAREVQKLLNDRELVRPEDTVGVLTFNTEVQELLRPTFVHNIDAAAIGDLAQRLAKSGSGGTELWRAMEKVLHDREKFVDGRDAAAAARGEKKASKKAFVLLVLTDGASSGDPQHLMEQLPKIATRIPHYHQFILGINLSSATTAVLERVTASNSKRCQFQNVRGGGSASNAIEEGFRRHFTKTLIERREVSRTISLHGNNVVVEEKIRDANGRIIDPRRTAVPLEQLHHLALGVAADRAAAAAVAPASSRPQSALTYHPHHSQQQRSSAPPPSYASVFGGHGQNQSEPPRRPCRFGPTCPDLALSRCTFGHPREHQPCKFGRSCHYFRGTPCAFKHL